MKTFLKRDSKLFKYETMFSSTTDFSPTLLVDASHMDIEPIGSVACTCYAVDNLISAITGLIYDHDWLWTQMIKAGKATSTGASPQDAFSTALTGVRVVPTGEIDTPVIAYFQVDEGSFDSFTNVKSAMQNEYNKGDKRPVGVGTKWYPEWNTVGPNGTVPLPLSLNSPIAHEWEICGWDEQHPDCFKINSWQGYYLYISRDVFNAVMDATYGSVALMFAQTTQEQIDYLKSIKISLWQKIFDLVFNISSNLSTKIQTLKPSGFPPLLYTVAQKSLGTHQTLNDAVPPDVGCAEAVSSMLQSAGVSLPARGIAGTAALYTWLKNNPRFVQTTTPDAGCIIISPTTPGAAITHGHVGIIAMYGLQYTDDWGIISNDSDTGLIREKWCLKDWINYYQVYGGLDVVYFRLI